MTDRKAHARAQEPDQRPRRPRRLDGRPMRRSGPVRQPGFPAYAGAHRQSGTTGDSADPAEDPNARGAGRPRRHGDRRAAPRDDLGE